MVTGSSHAERWATLAGESESGRVATMRAILEEVIALDDAERSHVIEGMVDAEYALDEAQLRTFTADRLRAWIAISQDNMDGASSLARGYDAAFDKLGATMAMRRSTVVQTVARHDLTPEEVLALFDLIPSLVRQVPRAAPRTQYYEKPTPKKPFWKFW